MQYRTDIGSKATTSNLWKTCPRRGKKTGGQSHNDPFKIPFPNITGSELNVTRHQLNELRKLVEQMNVSFIHGELRKQKEALGNLSTLVGIVTVMLSSWVYSWRGRVVPRTNPADYWMKCSTTIGHAASTRELLFREVLVRLNRAN